MATNVTAEVHDALRGFAAEVQRRLNTGLGVWPEDQLKPAIDTLLGKVGSALGKHVHVVTEAPQPASEGEKSGGRVDAAVRVGPTSHTTVLTGHVELKAPGKGGDPDKFKDKRNKDQWTKFKKLPNLIYTDGQQWTLHHTGKRWKSPITLSGDPVKLGADAVTLEDARNLELLFETFLNWVPIVPKTSRQIADLLAPLCRLLRTEAKAALDDPASALSSLADQWRKYLFPGASNDVVADAYAQTFTYALLIARFEGADPLTKENAEKELNRGHGLLSEVLGLLSNPDAYREVKTSADMLLRVIAEINPTAITKKNAQNPWLYFYEEFLDAYDPTLRKKVGAYYTPVEVVSAQTNIVRSLLVTKFGKADGFADPTVVTLDPAVGTGTYPLRILESVTENLPANAPAAKGALLRRAARNLYGIEYLIGPYSVAHLRLSRFLDDHGVTVKDDENILNVLLADTLASHEDVDGQMTIEGVFGYEHIYQEREEARELKADTRVVVCIGNPPYLRGKKTDLERGGSAGGWVTMRREPQKNVKVRDPITRRMVNDKGEVGIISDFLKPAFDAGRGGDVKNIYNSYVYFWRWAIWKVFEQEIPPKPADSEEMHESRNGIVSFITASSFLRGPGFVGVRQHMRATFDELWIIDLGGDNKGGRKTENVFSIETPVAITTGVRYTEANSGTPAVVHYANLSDFTAKEKKELLSSITGLDDGTLTWRRCLDGWQDPLLPSDNEIYLSWPALTDVFPWQTGGPQVKRTWPIGETQEVLRDRWSRLTSALEAGELTENQQANIEKRSKRQAVQLKESDARKVTKCYPILPVGPTETLPGNPGAAIAEVKPGTPVPLILPYAFRAMDRQWIIADGRIGDRMRPSLWAAHGDKQVYMTSMLTEVLGEGPGAVAAADVPDLHHFRGSFGGKHVIPLWKDADATVPNVTDGLIMAMSERLGMDIAHEQLFAYCYGLLATPSFVSKFWEELTIPGPRIPITLDADLFATVAEFGRHLLFLHTYGQRFASGDDTVGTIRYGSARYTAQIPSNEYPESFSYNSSTGQLKVGGGAFENVPVDVWEYSLSGMKVLDSWLGYRMKKRAGKSGGSPLDSIRPTEWPDLEGKELLTLMSIIEQTIALHGEGKRLLDEVLLSELLEASELPQPTDASRKALVDEESDPEFDDGDDAM